MRGACKLFVMQGVNKYQSLVWKILLDSVRKPFAIYRAIDKLLQVFRCFVSMFAPVCEVCEYRVNWCELCSPCRIGSIRFYQYLLNTLEGSLSCAAYKVLFSFQGSFIGICHRFEYAIMVSRLARFVYGNNHQSLIRHWNCRCLY